MTGPRDEVQVAMAEQMPLSPEHMHLLASGITDEEIDALSFTDALWLYRRAGEELQLHQGQ